MLLPHPVQRGTDQISIGLEESRWNSRWLCFDSLCATLQHSGVLHRVFLRNDVRNTLAVDDGFPIECKQSGAEFRAKSLIQTIPPVHRQYGAPCDRCFEKCLSCKQSLIINFWLHAEF